MNNLNYSFKLTKTWNNVTLSSNIWMRTASFFPPRVCRAVPSTPDGVLSECVILLLDFKVPAPVLPEEGPIESNDIFECYCIEKMLNFRFLQKRQRRKKSLKRNKHQGWYELLKDYIQGKTLRTSVGCVNEENCSRIPSDYYTQNYEVSNLL